MKTTLLVLFAAGMAHTATAQDSKYAKNYKVCRSAEGYEVCVDQNTSNLNDPAPKIAPERIPLWRQSSFISPAPIKEDGTSERIPTQKALKSSFPVKDWQEEENIKRNLNYGSGKDLPPTTGEIR